MLQTAPRTIIPHSLFFPIKGIKNLKKKEKIPTTIQAQTGFHQVFLVFFRLPL